jgi:GAF domain-containing protein
MTRENPRLCPSCGYEILNVTTSCPSCNFAFEPAVLDSPAAPEMLVQRFGEYLLDCRLIQQDELDQALAYQQKTAGERHVLLGEALVELGILDRDTLDQAITRKLVGLQTALLEVNRQLEQRVQQRTQVVERQLVQIRTAAEITQVALSTGNISDLLRRTVELLEERFKFVHAAIFITDETGQVASLREATQRWGKELIARRVTVAAGSDSMIGWVLEHKQPRVTGDEPSEDEQVPARLVPGARSQACLPILIGDQILGVLDVQHQMDHAFDPDTVAVLQTIANHIAAVIENYYLLETTQNYLSEVSTLYQASYQMARATTPDEVVRITTAVLKQTNQLAVFFVPEQNSLRRVTAHEPGLGGWGKTAKPVIFPDRVAISAAEINKLYVPGEAYLVREIPDTEGNSDLPEALIGPLRKGAYQRLALIQSRRAGRLEIIFLLAIRDADTFKQNTLQSFASLAEITSASLDKVYTSQRMEKRLTALQSLNAVSQAVSVETDLMALYQVVHREVISVIGNVHIAIATFDAQTDTIEVPYLYDGSDVRSLERFPAGEGLTSILIRTRQPMMLVEDTERKTRELGAKLVGKPAKSWLGVPLLIAGDAIGAIILQDLEHEGRFDEDDQRLLTTLASQVAVAIRNARMLEATYRQAERERRLYEITKRIRGAPDIPGIMQMTAQELGQILGARLAVVELGSTQIESEAEPPDEAPVQPDEAAEQLDQAQFP